MFMEMRSGYALEPWQTAAVRAWTLSQHPDRGTHHGILHVYTGAGKTVLAAAAMVEALADLFILRSVPAHIRSDTRFYPMLGE